VAVSASSARKVASSEAGAIGRAALGRPSATTSEQQLGQIELLHRAQHGGEPADIRLEGEWIGEIGPPGLAAAEAAATIDATGLLIHFRRGLASALRGFNSGFGQRRR